MSKQERWFSSPTQVYWACKALIDGRVISHKTEIREVKGGRLYFPEGDIDAHMRSLRETFESEK